MGGGVVWCMGFGVWGGEFSPILEGRSGADEWGVDSATLDLAYVASGAFDIWWEGGCWEW